MRNKRIGVLTGGGDCAGPNSAIKWLVKTVLDIQSEKQHGVRYEVLGIRDGFKGLAYTDGTPELERDHTVKLTEEIVRSWDIYGGTNLGTSRFSPYNIKDDTSGRIVLHNIEKLGLDILVVMGGDGTLNIAHELSMAGVKVVCIPKTISNDVMGTDYCLGFETAIETITDAVDKLRTSAGSHKWIFVIETIGQSAGWLALKGGESCGADIILIPEYDFSVEHMSELIIDDKKAGNQYEIVIVADGAKPAGKKPIVRINRYNETERENFGGVGEYLSDILYETTALSSRSLALGHIQRGGTPCAYDRRMGRYYGITAANLILQKKFGTMASYKNHGFTSIPLEEAIAGLNRINIKNEYDTDRYNGIRNVLSQ